MKSSTIKKYLLEAGVTSELHDQAISSISLAKERAKGIVWIKWKTRLFYTKKISKLLPWEAERLIDVKPLLGPLKLKIDIGFGIDNIWVESNDEQSWYPIPGYDLRAPVVWYVLPSL